MTRRKNEKVVDVEVQGLLLYEEYNLNKLFIMIN